MKEATKYITLLSIALFLGLTSCQRGVKLVQVQETRLAMGTLIEITVLDTTEAQARVALDTGFAEIERISRLFWEGNPAGPVYAFNHRTEEYSPMPREVLDLITRSCDYSRKLDGAFDITVAALFPLYRFRGDSLRPPDLREVQKRLPYVDYRALLIDTLNLRLGSRIRQTQIGFGAVAKGYGADRALQKIKALGVAGALVNAGGDLSALPRKDGKQWHVGIQHPRQKDRLLAVMAIDSQAVVTSGDYEKYFLYEGRRIHHLLNPRTGLSADSCQAVTVIAPSAELADAMATGLFVLGAQAGQRVLDRFPNCQALWVTHDGRLITSRQFTDYLAPGSRLEY